MIIVHKCQLCDHFEQEHTTGGCSIGYCKCNSRVMEVGPPEAVVTYVADDGAHPEVQGVHPPGTKWRGGGLVPTELCGCEGCRELAEWVS